MNVVIIEDEKPAADKLKKALQLVNPAIVILSIFATVQESIKWLRDGGSPELAFTNIEGAQTIMP